MSKQGTKKRVAQFDFLEIVFTSMKTNQAADLFFIASKAIQLTGC